MAYYAAVAGVAATVGLVLGGIFAGWLSWRVGFFINLPIGAAMMLAAPRFLPETERRRGAIDAAGAVASTLGMTALVFGIVNSAEGGWGDPLTLAAVGGGLMLLAVFVANERRAAHPIMPLRLFASRERSVAYAARRPADPRRRHGVAQPRRSRHAVSDRHRAADGAHRHRAGRLSRAPLTAGGLAGVAAEDAGAAGGVTNVAHQIGGSLGSAVLVAVFAAAGSSTLHGGALLAHRISASLTVGTLLLLLVLALLVAVAVRPRRARAVGHAPAGNRDPALSTEPIPTRSPA